MVLPSPGLALVTIIFLPPLEPLNENRMLVLAALYASFVTKSVQSVKSVFERTSAESSLTRLFALFTLKFLM